jgi:hypothetical protein
MDMLMLMAKNKRDGMVAPESLLKKMSKSNGIKAIEVTMESGND